MEMDEIINIKRARELARSFSSFDAFFSFFFLLINSEKVQADGGIVWVAWGKIKFTCFDGAMIPQNGNLIYECENFLSLDSPYFFFLCI